MSAYSISAALLGLTLACPAWAETKINGVVYESTKAAGAADGAGTNASLRLKKVFLFPAVDDVSGVLAPKLDEKLAALFSRDSRFDLVRDPQVMRALSPDDSAYAKAALSPLVHKEAARVTRSDTTALLRTRNIGTETEMTLELRDAEGGLIFSETGSVPGLSPMTVRWGLIEKLFQAILAKIPFDGSVTGRTASTLTLDLGSGAVKNGEVVELARIVSVQRHPLLGTVVGTDYVRAGKAKITSVDRSLSFAEVVEEYPGELISTGAKVLRTRVGTMSRGEPSHPAERSRQAPEFVDEKAEEKDPFEDRLQGDFDRYRARYGRVGGNLLYGSLSQSQASSGTTAEFSGSGLGGSLDGEAWVTKNWIFSAFYGFQSATLAGSNATVGDTSWRRMEGFVGYRFLPEDVGGGIAITGSGGYQAVTFDLPSPSGLNVGGKKFVGPALKLEGEVDLLPKHRVNFGVGFQPISSFTETGTSLGSPDGGTVIVFQVGWNYRLSDMFWTRVGFQFDSASGTYHDNASVTDKRFAIGPGLYYSF